jgi:hypothetical protein
VTFVLCQIEGNAEKYATLGRLLRMAVAANSEGADDGDRGFLDMDTAAQAGLGLEYRKRNGFIGE